MGSGGSKSHQAFAIAPAAVATPSKAGNVADGPAPDVDYFVDDDDNIITATPSTVHPYPVDEDTSTSSVAGADPQVAAVVADWDSDRVLTPIPDELVAGAPLGAGIAVGGADLEDGSVTLMSYNGPNGEPREVLLCKLTPDGEDKLLDALTPPDAPLVAVDVETTVTGRLPLDETNKLHEQLARVAKSINHHNSNNTDIPEHTIERLAELHKQLDELKATTTAADDAQMIDTYLAGVAACEERTAAGYSVGYAEGGKIDMIHPHEHTGPATITKMVPDPTWQGDGLVTSKRTASRIAAKLSNGEATWDGHSRNDTSGTELAVDLGDGYQAIYRPSTLNAAGSSNASQHHTLEIVAPAGAGNSHELVERLGQLNIVNRPMNRTEAEYSYLARNIYAHEIEQHPAVVAARASAVGLEDAHEHQLLIERGHQAAGLDDTQLASFARQLRLDAEASALSDKVRIMRGGVASALGYKTADALTSDPTYKPTPNPTGGWLNWSRVKPPTTSTFKGRSLTHRVTSGNLEEIFASGALASTERRRAMGIFSNKGMSEAADQRTGGARGVFLRMSSGTGTGGCRLVWDDPERILSRTDWYGYNGDHFGAAVAGTGHSIKGQTRNPTKAAGFTASNNEIIVANGLDLLGADAPSRVYCSSKTQRAAVLQQLTAAGVTHLAGRPIDKVIT